MKKKHLFRRILVLLLLVTMLLPIADVSEAAAAVYPYSYYKKRISTSVDRSAYNVLAKAAAAGRKTTSSFNGSYYDMNEDILFLVLFDHPEYFWVRHEYNMSTSWSSTGIKTTLFLDYEWNRAYQQKAAFNKKVNKIVKVLQKKAKGKTTVQKLRLIRDYICKNCVYQESAYDQTAYGVFMKHKAVCSGYAKAFKLLCDRMRIPCICVEGTVGTTGDANHLLNFVKVGKKWYYVDCTWEDNPYGAPYNRYFLLGKKDARCYISKSLGIRIPNLATSSISPRKYM